MKKRGVTNIDNGSVTLEACIAVPLFVLLIVFIYGFMFLFAGEQIVNHALIQSAESLSLDSYAAEIIDDTSDPNIKNKIINMYNSSLSGNEDYASEEKWYKNPDTVQTEVKKRFVAYLASGDNDYATSVLETFGIKEGLKGINFTECKVTDENDLVISITYEQEFLFNFNGLASVSRTKDITQKMW